MAGKTIEKNLRSCFHGCYRYHVKHEWRIVKRDVYIAIGIDVDDQKDVLGMYVGENESAKFWHDNWLSLIHI